MRRQNYNPVVAIILEHVPKATTSGKVHACCRLIKHHKSRVTTKSDGDRELSSVATREGASALFLVRSDTYVNDQASDLFFFGCRIASFEVIEDVEVLLWRKQLKQDVMLRADTKIGPDLVHLIEQVIFKDASLA